MPIAAYSELDATSRSLGDPPRFDDRMLAEATATWEQLDQSPPPDRTANEQARAVGGDFERRLVARAGAMPHAGELREAQRHVRAAVLVAVIAGLLFATLGGVATARAILGVPRDEPVNIFHVLAATLGPQTLLLAIWVLVMLLPHSSGPLMSIASLGGFIVRGGQWLARRIHPGRTYAAAVGGMSRTFLRGGLGRWTFSSISHALWLGFNIGCLGMLFFLLSTRQYAFAWETTILSESTYVPLTQAIGSVPKLAGFEVPSATQIAASQWRGEGSHVNFESSQAWSALLVGCLVVYGFAPRVVLLGWSLGRRRLAKRRYRLDVERPEFARLRSVLSPDATSLGVVDAQPKSMPGQRPTSPPHRSGTASPAVDSGSAIGLPVILGFELPPLADPRSWPPQVHGVRWHDLGMVDSRDDRHRVSNVLARSDRTPQAIIIVCGLTTTPDRGVCAFLTELKSNTAARIILVLTGGQRLRERNTDSHPSHATSAESTKGIEDRLNDWRAMAADAGLSAEHVLEVDLDHLTQSSQARLARIIGVGSGTGDADSPVHQRHLEQAMDLITSFVEKHDGQPAALDDKHLAALHADIARLYGDAPPRWRTLLRLPTDVSALAPAAMVANLSSTAKRFSEMLPDRLKRSPKWLAAGATAGALGCVAAAAMISPVAISALPIWSGLGAAIAAVAQPSSRKSPVDAALPESDAIDFGPAVRSAALFAMLLELQGYDELRITRVLDQAIMLDDSDAPLPAADVKPWLQNLRHRFDMAMTGEARA